MTSVDLKHLDVPKENKLENNESKVKSDPKTKMLKMISIASDFSQTTSINGLMFIKTSKSTIAKIIWTFLFLAAVAALIFHTYWTIIEYLSFKTKTSVERTLENEIPLPFVTICNKNPIRRSKLNASGQSVQDHVQAFSLDTRKELLQQRNVSNEYSFWIRDYCQNSTKEMIENCQTIEIDIADSGLHASWSELERNVQNDIGHQLSDMLLWCTFGKQSCSGKFKRQATPETGNCYTLDTSQLQQGLNGESTKGLDLGLFLEPDEYIPEISFEKGFQIALHEQNSFSYTSMDGFQLFPGTNSYIALQLEKTRRLQGLQSKCFDDTNNEFQKQYNFIYKQEFCRDVRLYQLCISKYNCTSKILHYLFDSMKDSQNINMCNVDEAGGDCPSSDDRIEDCKPPCSENMYLTRVTASQWPTPTLANVIVEYICRTKSWTREKCEEMKLLPEQKLRENFVSVNIFYESMYVNTYTEELEITLSTFLSNIGGCIGLWIGLSVLSLAEVLHFLVELVQTLCARKTKINTEGIPGGDFKDTKRDQVSVSTESTDCTKT